MVQHTKTALQVQFDDLGQQKEADTIGMWLFLGTEVMLFGGLFLGYAVYRLLYPEAWAEGSHHNKLWMGTLNTAILLVSSLTMALAVHEAEKERWKKVWPYLAATILFGTVFLGIKFWEYGLHYQEHMVPGIRFHAEGPHALQVELFMFFYFAMTSLHAFHMLVGLAVVGFMMVRVWMGRLTYHVPIEMTGLYWHLIDVIWVFLYPLFYLVG